MENPLLFEPILLPIIWGGNQLRCYRGLNPYGEPTGENWEVSAVPSSTDISNGAWARRERICL